jgi:hypothetical protein
MAARSRKLAQARGERVVCIGISSGLDEEHRRLMPHFLAVNNEQNKKYSAITNL